MEPGLGLAGAAGEVARACRDMAVRFGRGGQLITFGDGAAVTGVAQAQGYGQVFRGPAAAAGAVRRHRGQAAVELEQRAGLGVRDGYPVAVAGGSPVVVHGTDLVRAVVEDLRRGASR